MDSRIDKRMRAALIIEAVRQRGNDAEDLRDAAHEAAHVFQLELEISYDQPWERVLIHDALTARCRVRAGRMMNPITLMTSYEYQARAVEMLVCRELDVDYDLPEWAGTMILETAMLVGQLREDIDRSVACDRIRNAAATKDTNKIFKRVLALGERSP